MERIVALPVVLALAIVAQSLNAQSPPPIQDNSFLIEEAYNQERGVVQHISLFSREGKTTAWSYTFTQEWPVRGQRHQLSFSIPILSVPGSTGIGDVFLNYRLQLVGGEGSHVWVAPRVSAVLPSGSWRAGRGNGVVGLDARLPVSVELSQWASLHLNAGFTAYPSAHSPTGDKATLVDGSAGASIIMMPSRVFNFLVESVVLNSAEVTGPKETDRSTSVLLSPGVRWAFNFKSGLQIVPGAAYAFGLGNSSPPDALLLYLSFEHSFKH